MRELTLIDHVLDQLDRGLRAVHAGAPGTRRPSPATGIPEGDLNEQERRHAAALMRVNHAGEIAAQALYNGQALAAREPEVRARLAQSAAEETDHLAWCRERMEELGQHTSRLGPFWYWGAFAIGLGAGLAGDRWSLGFIKETEDQVVRHLEGHLQALPAGDARSRAIVQQMIEDETHHGEQAMAHGGVPLPAPVRGLMRLAARVMTTTAYRL